MGRPSEGHQRPSSLSEGALGNRITPRRQDTKTVIRAFWVFVNSVPDAITNPKKSETTKRNTCWTSTRCPQRSKLAPGEGLNVLGPWCSRSQINACKKQKNNGAPKKTKKTKQNPKGLCDPIVVQIYFPSKETSPPQV